MLTPSSLRPLVARPTARGAGRPPAGAGISRGRSRNLISNCISSSVLYIDTTAETLESRAVNEPSRSFHGHLRRLIDSYFLNAPTSSFTIIYKDTILNLVSTVKLCEGSLTALLERQSTDLRSTDECQWEAERRGASVIGQSGDLNVTLVSDQLQPPTFARTAGFVCNQRCHVLSAPENIANAGKKYFTDQQMVVFCLFLSCILDMQRCHARGVTQRRFCCEPSICFFVFSRFSF